MPQKPTLVDDIKNELRTLDSKINLVVQKLRTLEKNQEILSQTLLTLKAEVKQAGSGGVSAGKGQGQGFSEESETRIKEIEAQIKELRYVLDAINPLEYATIDQVKELLDEKLGKR